MVFSEEDKHAITFLRRSKTLRFIKEFLQKRLTLGGFMALIRKIYKESNVRHQPGSGHPRTVCSIENIQQDETLVLSQEGQPQTHRTWREIARQLNISQTSVNHIVKKDLCLVCFKKRKAQELTDANKQARLDRAQQLLDRYPLGMENRIWFTDGRGIHRLFSKKSSKRSLVCSSRYEKETSQQLDY